MEPQKPPLRAFDLIAIAIGLALGLLLPTLLRPPAPPQVQPSVPSLIAPAACDGRCGYVAPKPFRVTCPFCRNALICKEPATGEIGATVKPASK